MDKKSSAEELISVLLLIIKEVKADATLQYFALALLNGIVEDKRSRAKYLVNIHKSANASKRMDVIDILFSFIQMNLEKTKVNQRDLAAHTLAILIEAVEYRNCRDEADRFLMYLQDSDSQRQLSTHCITHCLMYILKSNELAETFTSNGGFITLRKWLENEALGDAKIAYNVCSALWVISYNSFTMEAFTDFRLGIIERVAKVLDYFSKENIVRIICMLFDVSLLPSYLTSFRILKAIPDALSTSPW